MARILIIKLGALGDVVMATPLIDAIMRHHASDSVTLLTTPTFSALFEAWPELTVHASPRHGAANMLRLLGWLRARGFDSVYDLQGSRRSAMLCALSGARRRAGNHPRWPYTHHPATPWHGQSHIFPRMVAVLASAGVEVEGVRPRLPASTAIRDTIDTWVSRHGADAKPLVLLHAGASAHRPGKRWPAFAALAARLRESGHKLAWLGTATERELNAGLASSDDIDATGAFTIVELAELARRARFAVTNDSGPMHVLSAAGIPVFGLFGPSDWRRNHALGQAENVIACVDHVPGYAGQACADCLRELRVETVWSQLCAAGVVKGPA